MYGTRIRELRLDRGWSQEMLARELGVTQITVSRYEREVLDLGTATIISLCGIFGVSADYLLGITDDDPRDFL